jgi:hypothetical protein
MDGIGASRCGNSYRDPLHALQNRSSAQTIHLRCLLASLQDNDFTSRFPLLVAAITALPRRSFVIDGKAIVTNRDGLPYLISFADAPTAQMRLWSR